jgi:hypothetical protein
MSQGFSFPNLVTLKNFGDFFKKLAKLVKFTLQNQNLPIFCWKRKQTTGSTKDHAHGQH